MLLPQSKEDFLVLCEGPTQGLDDTTITTETKHFTNFTRSKEVCMIIETTIFYLSMLQKYINSKQKTLKLESKYFVVMKEKKRKKKKIIWINIISIQNTSFGFLRATMFFCKLVISVATLLLIIHIKMYIIISMI